MKPKIDLGSLLLIFATSIVLVSCVNKSETYRFRLPELNEPIVGTWINESYLGLADHNPKWVFHNWGYGETFDNVSDNSPTYRWTYILVEKWKDADGNTWYKRYDQHVTGCRECYLVKINKNGSILEFMYYGTRFPDKLKLDQDSDQYRIFYSK